MFARAALFAHIQQTLFNVETIESSVHFSHDVASGSNSAVSRFLRHGCFTPETGHCLARLARQKSAIKRHRRSYSITSSARARSVAGTVIQGLLPLERMRLAH
jgi:hypothetical protein